MVTDAEISARILALLERRAPPSSICPSEVARSLAPDWRPLMVRVRAAAASLCDAGLVQVTQRGREVDPRQARGAIRLRRAQRR